MWAYWDMIVLLLKSDFPPPQVGSKSEEQGIVWVEWGGETTTTQKSMTIINSKNRKKAQTMR